MTDFETGSTHAADTVAVTAGDPLADLPGYLLRRAANSLMAELGARLTAHELRISEATVLLLINERTDLTSAEIGKLLEIQRANMVPLLARLEAAGLIHREPINRKSQAIVLTPLGHMRLNDVRAVTQRFETDLLERIPAQHRPHLVPALKALLG